jgi:hypothetical protein
MIKDFWSKVSYFNRSEFACECGCGFDAVDVELLALLIDLRYNFGPVTISGPNRCVAHNENIQKYYNPKYVPFSSKSYHTKGMAVDAKFLRADIREVYDYLVEKYVDTYGFILYYNRIHIDVRTKKYRCKK